MFDFKRLIKMYSKSPIYFLREEEGYHDPKQGGKWIEGTPEEVLIEGAIVPLSNEDLRYDEGGTYTTADRKIYCYTKMEKGQKIKNKEKTYTVLSDKPYEDFDTGEPDGLYIYIIRRGDRD